MDFYLIFPVLCPFECSGVGVTGVSIGGKQRIVISVDQSVFPSEELFHRVKDFMEDELMELKREADLHHQITMKKRKMEEIV